MLKWGGFRYERRLTVLNHPESGQQAPRSSALASKLLTIDKVLSAFCDIATKEEKIIEIKSISDRYSSLRAVQNSNSPNTAALLRGDVSLLRSAQRPQKSLLSVAHSYISSIKSSIGQFYKERRLGDIHDTDLILSMTLLADILGTSRIFEDLLELSGDWQPAARFHFCRALRKVGVYSYGPNLLFDAMTTCAGKKLKYFVVELVPSPPRIEVQCHDNWYEFLRTEALSMGYNELTVTRAFLESTTDLRRYEPQPMATPHAELNLAMHRKSVGGKKGEMGVSKACCATCTEGLLALGELGLDYKVKSSHRKPYIAQLTDFSHVDRAIVSRVKADFDVWLSSIINEPDLDVTDHEITVTDSADEDLLSRIEVTSVGKVDDEI